MEQYRQSLEENSGHDGALILHSYLFSTKQIQVLNLLSLLSFHLIKRVGGGTGSGLGSLIAQELTDEFPSQYLMGCGVMPFCTGETALQHYNSLLSMSFMSRYCDALTLFSNDHLMKIACHSFASSHCKKYPKRVTP